MTHVFAEQGVTSHLRFVPRGLSDQADEVAESHGMGPGLSHLTQYAHNQSRLSSAVSTQNEDR